MTQLHRQSLTAYGAPLCETVADIPTPRGTEVLVRIHRCGVCHSDLHMQDGYFMLGDDKKLDVRAGRTLPFTLGHEITGTIEAVGPDAAAALARETGADLPKLEAGRAGRGLSVDRLRPVRRLRARRGEHLRRPAPSRHSGRRRLCHARAAAAPALPDRLCAAVGVVRRRADVLGPDRLRGVPAVRAPIRNTSSRDRCCWSAWAASA